jgi:hypothetical protein
LFHAAASSSAKATGSWETARSRKSLAAATIVVGVAFGLLFRCSLAGLFNLRTTTE